MMSPSQGLLRALELALTLANEIAKDGNTGNGGVAAVLQTLFNAYRSGQAGSLARHVAVWVDRKTDELPDGESLPAALGVETRPFTVKNALEVVA